MGQLKVNRIPYNEFCRFVDVYFREKVYTVQRFGQAFMNHYGIKTPDAEVFNEENIKRAMELVQLRYVQTESVSS